MKRRRHTVGMAPGSVVFVGDDRDFESTFSLTVYGPSTDEKRSLATVEEAVEALALEKDADSPPDDGVVRWLDVCGVHNTHVIERLGQALGISSLILEDIANTGQRPKTEPDDNCIFISTKMMQAKNGPPGAHPQDPDGLHAEQISLLIVPGAVISFQEVPGDVLDPLRNRIQSGRGRIRTAGPAYLAYAILDVIVDHYFVILESLGQRAEILEDEILASPDDDTQEQLNNLRRDLVYVRRHAWPGREVLSGLERISHPLWPDEELRPFIRDAYEHAVQVLDMTESLRDLTGGLTDLYMTTLSNRMNEVMKVLTIIGTIFIPLTFVAGIYGMNFENMPELSAPHGYPIAMSLMGIIAVTLVFYFRRKGWL